MPNQKRRIKINCRKAIRRRDARLNENVSEPRRMEKSPQTYADCLPNSQTRNYYMDGKHYSICLACQKSFLRHQPPTAQINTDCDCRKTAVSSSRGNYM